MGFTSQGAPFKACSSTTFFSFSPPFRRSIPATASRSYLLLGSGKGFGRHDIRSYWAPADSYSAMANSDSLKSVHGSGITYRSFTTKDSIRVVGGRGYCCGSSQLLSLKMHSKLGNSHISCQTVEEENKQSLNAQLNAFPSSRESDYGSASRTSLPDTYDDCRESWLKESEIVRAVRLLHIAARGEIAIHIPQDVTMAKAEKIENIQDEGLSQRSVFSTSFCSQRFDNVFEKGALQNSINRQHVRYNMEKLEGVADLRNNVFTRTEQFSEGDRPRQMEKSLLREPSKSNGHLVREHESESNVDPPQIEEITPNNAIQNEMPYGESANAGQPIEKHFEKISSMKGCAAHLPDLEKLICIYDKILIVDNISMAKRVVEKLTTQYKHLIHACDTEVSKIDVKLETPVDHGEIICFSIFSGSEADFDGKSCIWVDVLGGGKDVLKEFAPFFEDPTIKKVWHNYSFDCHVLENYGFNVAGFHADTMHLARLWDSSRRTKGGYSLEALTGDRKLMSHAPPRSESELLTGKISMKSIFGKKKIKKDGTEGKLVTIAPVEELQRNDPKTWICYSVLDSVSTLRLFESLKAQLMTGKWSLDGVAKGSMYDFYEEYWRPFGELLVNMESEGMLVDREYLSEMQQVASEEQKTAAQRFRKWASRYCPDAKYMNVGSDLQLRQLFFGGTMNKKDPNETLGEVKIFKVPNVDNVIEEGKKVPTKYRNIELKNLGFKIETEIYTAKGWPSVSGNALKVLAGKVSADQYVWIDDTSELQADDCYETLSNSAVDESEETEIPTSSVENAETSAYGTAYQAFGGGKEGRDACHAIAALCEVCSIDSLISNFILPLQGNHISGANGRIHCSLNINTETGRLSARRPSLQNQPALEKDRYKIRQAFIAEPGNSLIVADYGQLELRILAHLANCKSMLDAFRAGGDFHSRTAMNMYPHIRKAVEDKKVLLEWSAQPGEEKPPVPLLKDAFASERRKAKMLNFSIAYGKTPVGLARDWKVSVKEAKKTVDLWYNDRKEVRDWQEQRKCEAEKYHCVYTLLGRARHFPSMANMSNYWRGHIERAAINTPVQGSAADVAMCAMLEISRNARLKELGWRLLLQVHDEVILEGPTESAEVAKAIVVECMSKPFYGTNFLKVDLAVDAKCAQNWYSAK